ncbi:hypothetical protein G9A89_014686 [Geosiphon pyriformis]|nr:hypothetical protein G9A89_014686 [Geosiphon pyriformis]
MEKTTEVFGSKVGFRPVFPRKKRRGDALEDGSGGRNVGPKGLENGDTIESNSIDMEEKCLMKEIRFDYNKSSTLAEGDPNQTLIGLKVKTKKILGKLLDKIKFSLSGNEDDVFLKALLKLLSSLKNLVNVSVCKSFILNIGLDKVKLQVIRKLFSKINSFGKASTLSKFAGIIRATFTFKLSLAQAFKKTEEAKILVNTNLKKSSGHLDQTVVLKEILIGTSTEAVCTALSEFGIIKSIKIQLKDAVRIVKSDVDKELWDAKDITLLQCAAVCFDFAESLDAVMETMSVLKGANLHWSCLVLVKYIKYKKLGHMSLYCLVGRNKDAFSGVSSWKTLSDSDKSRLAAIYAKCSAPVVHPVSFGGVSWAQIAGGSSFPPSPVWNVLLNAGSSSEMKPTSLIMNKFDGVCVFTSSVNSNYLGSDVAIIIDNSLASHVCKVSEVSGWILFVKLLFKNKLSVTILELYTDASSVVWFFQASDINFLIAKAINKFFFVILGSDFNEDNFHICASFRKYFDLGLVNFLAESLFAKIPMWCNFCGVTKIIGYMFVFLNLVNAMVSYNVASIEDYFDTNYVAVSVSLSGLLDVQLSSLHKQINRNHWKFNIKNVTAANTAMFSDAFEEADRFSDLDAM